MVGRTHIAHSCLKANKSKVCFVSVFRYDDKICMGYNWVAMNMRTSGKSEKLSTREREEKIIQLDLKKTKQIEKEN